MHYEKGTDHQADHMSHAVRNYCIIAALCKSNKDDFESKIIMNRLFHSLYIFLNLWCLYFLSVGLLVKKMSTLSKKKDVLFSEMTIISCKLRNTKEGCLHMAQNQLYPELIIDFSRSCLTYFDIFFDLLTNNTSIIAVIINFYIYSKWNTQYNLAFEAIFVQFS